MKYRDDGRKFCEDTSFKKGDVCPFFARIPVGDPVCQFYCKTVYCRTGNFQHICYAAVCLGGNHRGRIYAIPDQGAPVSGSTAGRHVIYKASEIIRGRFLALDGLFQRDAADHGGDRHGSEGNPSLHCRGFASFPVLYPGMHRGALVLLDVPPESVEQAENGLCGSDAADGADPGGICQPGMDESFSGDLVERKRT